MKMIAAAAFGIALIASIQEASAQSLSYSCQIVYRQYRAANGPKAFAITNFGTCGWWHGGRTMGESQRNAIIECRRMGQPGCRIVETSY